MKKALLILVPLLLLGGGATVGLGMLGIVNLPFLPLGKKKVKLPPDDGKGGPLAPFVASMQSLGKRAEAEAARLKAIKPPPAPKLPPDPSAGEAKLAGLWAEMPTDKLVALTAKWPIDSLGRILARMDADAVTNLLAALPPPRAADLSRAVAAATDETAQKVHTDLKNG